MAAHPLFQGATFNAGYNANRSAVHVATPSGLRRAVLAALITGVASAGLRVERVGIALCIIYAHALHRLAVNPRVKVLNTIMLPPPCESAACRVPRPHVSTC